MKLEHTMLRVRDLDASITFYTEFCGLQELRRHELGDEATLVFLGDGETDYCLELTYNKDGRDYELGTQYGHLALRSDRPLDELVADVEKRGWWYRRNADRYIFVRDPDGYDVELLAPRKEA